MKKLGLLTALWLCYDLWDWLAKNPDKGKGNWIGWSHNGGKYKSSYACFACTFISQYKADKNSVYGAGCQYRRNPCIIPCFRIDYGCTACLSPYNRYNGSLNNKSIKKYARIIADSAYKEYVKLGGKKRK